MRFLVNILLLISLGCNAQNALVLNGAYIVMNGGTFSNNIQLVINQSQATGITRNSGHIISESQYNYVNWTTNATGNYIFPFGYSISDYLPVSINKTSGGNTELKISTWGTGPDNMPFADSSSVAACTNMNSIYGGSATTSVIDRWWDIVNSNSLTADITFSYRGAENTTSNPTSAINSQRWNGDQWLWPSGTAAGVTSGVGTLAVFGQTTFSPFILVNSGAPLPIDLISFLGNCNEGNIELKWQTAHEENSNYFTIERSADGLNWNETNKTEAVHNSNVTSYYSLIDEEINRDNDIIYYRLRETDVDGTSKTFPPIAVQSCTSIANTIVYPNPFTNIINVEFTSESTYQFIIRSVDGKEILNKTSSGIAIQIDPDFAASGVYILTIINTKDNTTTIKRIIKQ